MEVSVVLGVGFCRAEIWESWVWATWSCNSTAQWFSTEACSLSETEFLTAVMLKFHLLAISDSSTTYIPTNEEKIMLIIVTYIEIAHFGTNIIVHRSLYKNVLESFMKLQIKTKKKIN